MLTFIESAPNLVQMKRNRLIVSTDLSNWKKTLPKYSAKQCISKCNANIELLAERY